MSFLQLSHKTTSIIIAGGILLGYALMLSSGRPMTQAYIIQGQDLSSVQTAVAARVSPNQRKQLEEIVDLHIQANASV